MREVQSGRVDRFARIVGRHQSSMFRYARSRLGSASLAEDAVQDAFLAAFESRHTYDSSRGFRAWLWTILVNRCRRLAKLRGRRIDAVCDAESAVDAPGRDAPVGAELEREDDRRRLAELLERLPVDQADAIRMRYFGELSYDEIGESLSCSPATIKSRVRYGLAKMGQLLSADKETTR